MTATTADRRHIRDIAERCAASGKPPIDVVRDEEERRFMQRHSGDVWDTIAELRNSPTPIARRTTVDVRDGDVSVVVDDDPPPTQAPGCDEEDETEDDGTSSDDDDIDDD